MKDYLQILYTGIVFLGLSYGAHCRTDSDESAKSQNFKIDGKVAVPFTGDQEWIQSTRVLVDGGEYIGYLRYI